ncbi:DUF1648 domain-containing protein [Streptomyces violascens]|uniref:DUF1648 domain-containing protein n=1 Tax=Streptomyces violascens TaxID=67381 RepID=A0ABQ3R0F4_9ACTN|nr:DUF1648 domain-containing protein [Streptomyces violascens]GGU07770.1 hypothetical protein GCM10010289_31040 [Streptomyces violascens]GHI43003.1 hypothetical protein Sviol_74110 [Streptomyces violascens]
MNRVRYRLMALAVLPFLLAMAVDLTAFALLRDRLPDRLASHFTASGSSDDTQSHTSYLVLVLVMHIGLAALWAVVARTGDAAVRGLRWMVWVGYAVAGLVGYLMVAVLVANADAADPGRVRMPLWQLVIGAGCGALAAGIGRLLLLTVSMPAPLPSPGPGEPERLDLAEGEVAGWMRRAPSRVLLGTGLAMIATALVLLYAGGTRHALVALGGALICLAFSCPYVTVDRHGLTARPTVLPWPRIRVPLSDVDRAISREIKILAEYGGWGYRMRPGKTGLMLRSGEALVVRRAGGREFAVTVDDSATAAALLNTLADREGAKR